MKQTAVEWLIEEMHKNIDWIPVPMQEQALEMEKEQIIDACDYGIKLYINDPNTSEDYYNETYKQD
jgi:hypothetical protein